MSHYLFGKSDDPVTLIADGAWHHLPLMRATDPERSNDDNGQFVTVKVENGWIIAVAPPEAARYELGAQLNGKSVTPKSVLELRAVRYPLDAVDNGTSRTYIDLAGRIPAGGWADTKRIDILINPPGDGYSELVGIDYAVKVLAGGSVTSVDRKLKFNRWYDIR